ncbi:MAG: glycosyl hydrolase family 28-related protein [Ginsengibacter sp.]
MSHIKYIIAIFFLTNTTFSVTSQVIPSSRSTDWKLAGYHGVIPVYPLVKNITEFGGSGDGITSNDLPLQNAITSLAGQNGIIHFPAGTFIFHSPVNLRSGLVLKGDGPASTNLSFNLSGTGDLITIAGSVTASVANIISSVFRNESTITVDNASLFQVNDYIKIYQDDDALVNDVWALQSVGQIIHIENILQNTITFSNGLRRNYLIGDAPKIVKLTMATGVGIECLKIKRLDSTAAQTANVKFSNAAKCWIKGVESDSCNFGHIQISNSTNIEVTNSYFHGSFGYGGGGQGYGIACEYTSGECLIENNIFKHLRHSMLLQSGANGNVFDYNYSIQPFKTESWPNDLVPDIVLHGNYPYLNLFEGNIVQNMFADASHSINGPYNTLFRNRSESYGIVISAGAGDSIGIVGNEISGSGFGKGSYIMQGNGNFEYGNNKNNTIVPTGTSSLPDQSFLYSSKPYFWNISSPWPSIGVPNTLNNGTIPAKERFSAGSNLTFCIILPVAYTFTGNGDWTEAGNWNNNIMPPPILSNGSQIIIDPIAGGRCILNIPYTVSPGTSLMVMAGKIFLIQGNLTGASNE